MGVWKAIRNCWETFKANTCFRVSFRNMVKFLKDRWCGDVPLREVFPYFFSIASFKWLMFGIVVVGILGSLDS